MAQPNPNKKAQMAHVVNLLAIANLDGNITENEKELVLRIANMFGLTDEEFDVCVKTVQSAPDKVFYEVPESDDEKTCYLKNLTTMMMIDGQIDENEKQYIKIVAEKFGYDGDKALEILINSVYDDFRSAAAGGTTDSGQSTHESEKKNGEMTEEEFKAETQRLIALGKEDLQEHRISKAFDHLFLPAHVDGEGLKLFLMIINTYTRLYLLTKEQVAMLKDYAEKGYAVSQYAYGRYQYIVRPESDSIKVANEYLQAAEKAGMPDAIQAQAEMMRDGHYGAVDLGWAQSKTEEAGNNGSVLATRAMYRKVIFGHDNTEPNPQLAIDVLKKWLNGDESEDISVVNPMYYELLGDAYDALGDDENAEKYYMKAIQMGHIEACGNYCLLYGKELETEEETQAYIDMLTKSVKAGDPNSCLYLAAYYMDNYENYSAEEQPKITKQIEEYLKEASDLGSRMAPYFIGSAYYYGDYGFEQDNKKAWGWAAEGTQRDNGDAYKLLAYMISNQDNPDEVQEGMLEYCAIMSLRCGCDDLLKLVVESYHNGELTDYAAEIEKYYIPKYDALPDEEKEDDDEDEDEPDEEDYDETDYKLIAIVKTDGTADIIEFDVEEGWDELPEFVGANRLDAIRTQPLYDVSKQVGLTNDHVTAWVDNMGLMKDLMMNPIGRSLYPGPVAGDMILTLEDSKYNPKSFESIEQLKKVIAALGAKLDNVILDDGPDDDGRFDAWS